jgi:hypothetical protein
MASRLESAATPGEILISYETFAQVREQFRCEDKGAIQVKGIAYPVATYKVLDSYEALGRPRRRIREDLPNARLHLDLDAMTAEERNQAADLLRQALEMVSSEHDAPGSNHEPGKQPTGHD